MACKVPIGRFVYIVELSVRQAGYRIIYVLQELWKGGRPESVRRERAGESGSIDMTGHADKRALSMVQAVEM